MTFSGKIKQEISTTECSRAEYLSELSGIIRTNAEIKIYNIKIQTENKFVANRQNKQRQYKCRNRRYRFGSNAPKEIPRTPNRNILLFAFQNEYHRNNWKKCSEKCIQNKVKILPSYFCTVNLT
jgi:hypothetical protein